MDSTTAFLWTSALSASRTSGQSSGQSSGHTSSLTFAPSTPSPWGSATSQWDTQQLRQLHQHSGYPDSTSCPLLPISGYHHGQPCCSCGGPPGLYRDIIQEPCKLCTPTRKFHSTCLCPSLSGSSRRSRPICQYPPDIKIGPPA